MIIIYLFKIFLSFVYFPKAVSCTWVVVGAGSVFATETSLFNFSAGGVWKAACCSCAILVGVFVSDFIHLHDCRKAAEKQSPEKDLFRNKNEEKSEREWKINGHCSRLVSFTLENSLLAELANDRRLKVWLWRRNKKLIFIYLTTWNFVWYVLASNQVSSFCFCLVSLFPPSSLNKKRYKHS